MVPLKCPQGISPFCLFLFVSSVVHTPKHYPGGNDMEEGHGLLVGHMGLEQISLIGPSSRSLTLISRLRGATVRTSLVTNRPRHRFLLSVNFAPVISSGCTARFPLGQSCGQRVFRASERSNLDLWVFQVRARAATVILRDSSVAARTM